MWMRRRMLTAAGCLLLAGVAAAFLLRDKEPRYQRRPLSAWVLAYAAPGRKHPDTELRQAADAIRHIGTNAVPFLLTWIRYETPPGKAERLAALSRPLNWLNKEFGAAGSWALRDSEADRATAAVSAFGVLGDQAHDAIPELTELLTSTNHTDGCNRAGQALANMPTFGLRLLATALTNSNPTIRARAATSARYLSTNATPIIPALIQTLKDDDLWVALPASWSLSELHPEPHLLLPMLTECLRETNAVCRACAAHVLERIGAQARPAIPFLLTTLTDTNVAAHSAAYDALREIDPDSLKSPELFSTVTNALRSPYRHLRLWATASLHDFGPRAEPEVPTLVHGLSDPDWAVSTASIVALGSIGEHASSALPHLLPFLTDTNALVRNRATNAIRRIAPQFFTHATTQ